MIILSLRAVTKFLVAPSLEKSLDCLEITGLAVFGMVDGAWPWLSLGSHEIIVL